MLGLSLVCGTVHAGTGPAARWILVDTTTATLSVMDAQQPVLELQDIAIGRYGTNTDKLHADNTTPIGRYRVTGIRHDSRFHRFIALDYPDVPRAQRAYAAGQIDRRQLQTIVAAHRRGKVPPQTTTLGGHIGIHGLGSGDPAMHRALNWTKGCIALTDAQIDALLQWVGIGTSVVIR